jgi:hypothetical protein
VNFRDLTKAQRRSIRDLAALAHERELSAELGLLEAAFRRWRERELEPLELNELIHAFHQGPSRKLYVAYTDSEPVLPVAFAIARGILAEAEVPEHVREFIAPSVAFARDHLADASSGDDPDAPS